MVFSAATTRRIFLFRLHYSDTTNRTKTIELGKKFLYLEVRFLSGCFVRYRSKSFWQLVGLFVLNAAVLKSDVFE
ncbi:hypothetical protein L596_008202 [Steinernema carpocapsae]|uniref:Uncharacterized protein n=1 Tax=Steinernema carpocapsae TaxID=34508 RepID=A0A4U5PBR5_STECR|nr:hypothetical protein L596_008202 [Steinernema carpocapsae]